MVYGLEKFREYFRNYTNNYVFIGGTACDILLNHLGTEFRATKDFDIVLIVEALDDSFGETFWKFIEDGEYQHKGKSEGSKQFYRFSKPRQPDFPKMIELFSRNPRALNLVSQTRLVPIHIDESILSLSAILLDDAYYDLLLKSQTIIDDYSVIELETVILFKVKAWLDMSERYERGEQVDSRNITKHKNDVFRLLVNLLPTKRIIIDGIIKDDLESFIRMIDTDRPNLRNLGIKTISYEEMIDLFIQIFINPRSVTE